MSTPSTDRGEVVILVHGTGAGLPQHRGERWWQLGSQFAEALNERLGPAIQVSEEVFHWSGDNLESSRRRAGQRLYERLKREEREGRVCHLIGHSHGGSVIWHALLRAAAEKNPLPQVNSWTTVATPFLHFVPDPLTWKVLKRWILSLLGYVLFAGTWEAGSRLLEAQGLGGVTYLQDVELGYHVALWLWGAVLSLVLIYISFGVLSQLLPILRYRRRRRHEKYVSETFMSRWTGATAGLDEAVGGLQSSIHVDPQLLHRRDYIGLAGAVLNGLQSIVKRKNWTRSIHQKLSRTASLVPPVFWPPLALATGLLSLSIIGVQSPDAESLVAAISGRTVATLAIVPLALIATVAWIAWRITRRFADRAMDAEARGMQIGAVPASPEGSIDAELESDVQESDDTNEHYSPDRPRVSLARLVIGDLYALVYNHVVLPIMDDFVWTKITQTVQGNDQSGVVLAAVSSVPLAGVAAEPLPEQIEEAIVSEADDHAAHSLRRVRAALTRAAFGSESLKEAFGNELSYRELVHNTYFHNRELQMFLFSRIDQASRGIDWETRTFPASFVTEQKVRDQAATRALARTRLIAIPLLALTIPLVIGSLMFFGYILLNTMDLAF